MENRKEIIIDIMTILEKDQYKDLSFHKPLLSLCEETKEVQDFKKYLKVFILPLVSFNKENSKNYYYMSLLDENFLTLLNEQKVKKYIECVHQLKVDSPFDESALYDALKMSLTKIEKDEYRDLPLKVKFKMLSENIKTSFFVMDKENESYVMELVRKIGKR
jgi:hypothetical protein